MSWHYSVCAMTPNDPKLSDRGVRRGTCMAGGKAAAEAATVTHGAVLWSAWLGLLLILRDARTLSHFGRSDTDTTPPNARRSASPDTRPNCSRYARRRTGIARQEPRCAYLFDARSLSRFQVEVRLWSREASQEETTARQRIHRRATVEGFPPVCWVLNTPLRRTPREGMCRSCNSGLLQQEKKWGCNR